MFIEHKKKMKDSKNSYETLEKRKRRKNERYEEKFMNLRIKVKDQK